MAYNYIPVDLYLQPINQQNRSLRVAVMLPPRLAARWAAAQIKDLVATKTPHNNHSPTTLHVALCLLDFLTTEVVLEALLVGSKYTVARVL